MEQQKFLQGQQQQRLGDLQQPLYTLQGELGGPLSVLSYAEVQHQQQQIQREQLAIQQHLQQLQQQQLLLQHQRQQQQKQQLHQQRQQHQQQQQQQGLSRFLKREHEEVLLRHALLAIHADSAGSFGSFNASLPLPGDFVQDLARRQAVQGGSGAESPLMMGQAGTAAAAAVAVARAGGGLGTAPSGNQGGSSSGGTGSGLSGLRDERRDERCQTSSGPGPAGPGTEAPVPSPGARPSQQRGVGAGAQGPGARELGQSAMQKLFPNGVRVLVVDDESLCLVILERMLQRCSYKVTTCNRATTALALLRERPWDFDLVISDVHMPDMDGFKLLELIGLEMEIPVIMMSADGETELVMKGVVHGAVDYLIKPVRMEELRNLWQHIVRRRPHINAKAHEMHSAGHEEDASSGHDDPAAHRHTSGDESEAPSSARGAPPPAVPAPGVRLNQQALNLPPNLGSGGQGQFLHLPGMGSGLFGAGAERDSGGGAVGSPGEGMGLVGDAGPMQLKRKRTGEEEEAAVASAGAAAGAGAGAGGVGGGAEWDVSLRGPRRGATLEVGMGGMKKGRVIWDKHLHQQFVSAVKKLGVDKAVPKKILDLMGVSGLTRENVASHLQKYRLYLKRLSAVTSAQAMGLKGGGTRPASGLGDMDALEGEEGPPQGLGNASPQQPMLQRPQAGPGYAAPGSPGAGRHSDVPGGASGAGAGLSANWVNRLGVVGAALGVKEERQEVAGMAVKLEQGGALGVGGGRGGDGGAGAAPGLTGDTGAAAGERAWQAGHGAVRTSSGNSANSCGSSKSGAHRSSIEPGAMGAMDQSLSNPNQGSIGAGTGRSTNAGAGAGLGTGAGREGASGSLLQEQQRQLAVLEAQQQQLCEKQSTLEAAQAAHPSPAQEKEILLLQRLQAQQQQLVLLHRRQVQLLAEFGSQDAGDQIQNDPSPVPAPAATTPAAGVDAANRAVESCGAGIRAEVGANTTGAGAGAEAAPGAPQDAPPVLHFPEELRTVHSGFDGADLDRLPSADFLMDDLGAAARNAAGGGGVHQGQTPGVSRQGSGAWKGLSLPVAGQGGGLGEGEGEGGAGELPGKQFALDAANPALAVEDDLFSLLWQQEPDTFDTYGNSRNIQNGASPP